MTKSAPFIRQRRPTGHWMAWVLAALVPGILVQSYFFGPGVLLNVAVGGLSAWLFEALALGMRGQPLQPTLRDSSALLTGVLLALSLPAGVPVGLILLATGFAILLGKQLFGGLGNNPFNPAMLGYALLLLAFPLTLSQHLPEQPQALQPVGWLDAWSLLWSGHSLDYSSVSDLSGRIDSLSSATPLSGIQTGLRQQQRLTELWATSPWHPLTGHAWLWINLAFFIGGLWLIRLRILAWTIPLSMLLSLSLCSGLMFLVDADRYLSPLVHLGSGATCLGALFIATDPVTAATTPKGRWLYGALIGVLLWAIRSFSAYPDGVAFAVLLANWLAPTIDRYCQPRVYGTGRLPSEPDA